MNILACPRITQGARATLLFPSADYYQACPRLPAVTNLNQPCAWEMETRPHSQLSDKNRSIFFVPS